MRAKPATLIVVLCFLGLMISLPLRAAGPKDASCPDAAAVQEKVSATFAGRQVMVKKVTPSPMPGLCQVHVLAGEKNQILYTDASGRYLVLGQILDAQDKRNLTQAALEDLNRLSPEDLKMLKEYTAFTLGPDNAPKTLYFVTDPQCPYCKQAETALEAMASEGVLSVRYILFPLPIHPGARESCIALICDKKGHDEFKSNYKSENQCPEGTEKIDAVMKFMQAHGIGGTPTYIFSDGTFRSGVMDRSALESKLTSP